MRNFIDVLDDKSSEEKLEIFYNKNKKYILPLLATIFIAVFSFDAYKNSSTEQAVNKSNLVNELKHNFDISKFNSLSGTPRILLIDDIVKSKIQLTDKKELLLKLTNDNSAMRPMTIEYIAESLIGLGLHDDANDLLSQNEASLSSISLLMRAKVYEDNSSLDEALIVYHQALARSKTPGLKNFIKLKIKTIEQPTHGVKK